MVTDIVKEGRKEGRKEIYRYGQAAEMAMGFSPLPFLYFFLWFWDFLTCMLHPNHNLYLSPLYRVK